jgi:hypothetical protein
MENTIKSAIVISDIRNFTGTFADFQKMGSHEFIDFISDFYNAQIKIARTITNNFWYNSLGDSMLFIFQGKNHSRKAYVFSMMLHRYLKTYCNKFNEKHNTKVSFGIGVDCGDVTQMFIKDGDKVIPATYLGNVINVVSRIEELTKKFGETEMLVGGNIYDYLMQDLYPVEYSFSFFNNNYTEMLRKNPKIVLMSDNILLYYIFKLTLDGIENSLPLFRYDNQLASEDDSFYAVIEKLVGLKIKNDLSKLF